ncbi:hypothetical protein DICVIV_08888 [Dictyocaulus viviparus]|uniref:Uncharacterized protein n=1 Tax=Dictyocaulus viviparus TaxID=29172 RepID=A0A0D8XRQ6_DICVI|nr:hypothetical protein DICVIV_08888 [Dictyocaulus viviparus]
MGKLVCMFGVVCFVTSDWLNDLNLPSKLLEYVIRYDPLLKEKCERMGCPFDRKTLSNGRCWGYEKNCSFQNTYSAEIGFPSCKFSNKRRKFFDDADFGYVTTRSHMHEICLSSDKMTCGTAMGSISSFTSKVGMRRIPNGTSSIQDFFKLSSHVHYRYRDDIIQPGEVGGNCAEFNGGLIATNMNERGYLRSWADELKHFVSVPTFSVNYNHCDIIFERPTVVMKLDASIDVVWWDTFSGGFVDAFFGETWKVFTDSKPVELTALAGRRVCFKNVLFPLLARQRFGLYYNMPLEEGCHGSGLIHAFSQYVLYRLRIIQHGPLLDGVRVTILSRSTQYRRILNLEEVTFLSTSLFEDTFIIYSF